LYIFIAKKRSEFKSSPPPPPLQNGSAIHANVDSTNFLVMVHAAFKGVNKKILGGGATETRPKNSIIKPPSSIMYENPGEVTAPRS